MATISILLLVLLVPAFLLLPLWSLLRLLLGLLPGLLPHLALGLWLRLLPYLALRLWLCLLPYLGSRLVHRLLSHLLWPLRLDLPLARLNAGHLRPTASQTLGLIGSIFLLLSLPLPLLLLLLLLWWRLLRLWSWNPPRLLRPNRGGGGGRRRARSIASLLLLSGRLPLSDSGLRCCFPSRPGPRLLLFSGFAPFLLHAGLGRRGGMRSHPLG